MNRDVEKESKNKALVLEALDTLFNRRDYVAAEKHWSPGLVQHSAHVPPGRDGLFALVKGAPATLRYEPGLAVAEGDYVVVHGRYSGLGPAALIAIDVVRVENGRGAEHWDTVEQEATRANSKGASPMFGSSFPGEGNDR